MLMTRIKRQENKLRTDYLQDTLKCYQDIELFVLIILLFCIKAQLSHLQSLETVSVHFIEVPAFS